MLLHLTDLSEESLQSQIIRQIRAMILAGALPAGSDLPSIRKMAREQHISVITVQRAYENLEREGLIHSRRGKGFFVSKLSRQAKKDMAENKLRDSLAAPVEAALAEGLAFGDISRIVADILKGKPSRRP